MLTWLQATAAWVGPIAAILNFLIALVGVPVAIWKGRQARDAILRWFASVLGWAQDASNKSADAAHDARAAKESAGNASENSRQANETLGFVGETLGDSVGETRRMARRLDDFLTANLQLRTLLTQHGIPIPETARINGVVTGEVDELTITGRHRLHTQMLPTTDGNDDDDEP